MLNIINRNGAIIIAALAILTGLVLTVPIIATAGDIDNEGPAFTNAAQVAHAEDLAQKRAGQPAPEVAHALKTQARAKKALQEARKSDNAQAIAAAEEAHRAAEANAQSAMAQVCAVTTEDIAAMRHDAMDWEDIADTLGVQPSALGLAYSNRNVSQHHLEMSEATARDVKGGNSTMHGVHTSDWQGSKAMGLDHTTQSHDGGMSGEHDSSMGGDRDSHGGGGHDGGGSGGGHDGGGGGGHDGGGGGGHDGGGGGGHM